MHPSSAVAPGRPYRLVDQHAHPLTGGDPGLGVFERQLTAAATGTAAGGGTPFDSRLGLAVLRWCPPLLGLEPYCPPVAYLARRRALGPHTVLRRLLDGSGVAARLLAPPPDPPGGARCSDAAWPGVAGTSPARFPEAGRTKELTVLGDLLGQLAATSGTSRTFLRYVTDGVHHAAVRATAFVCDAGPLSGLEALSDAPDPGALRRAADRQLLAARTATVGGRGGLGCARPADKPPVAVEPLILHHLVREALSTGRPVQLRCPDPAPLAGLLHATVGRGRVVLLPDPPHHRTAARMAATFPHVYADAGPDPAETLPEAPFGKLLFTSRAGVLPELRLVRARVFRRNLARVLDGWVTDGDCPAPAARRIADRVGGATARWLYDLPTVTDPAAAR